MHEQIQAVQTMQDYIANHLFEDISLTDLANASHFSPWYAHRLFLRYVGLSPAEYIRKYRLSKSALTLRDHPRRITDLAFEMGFKSVDGYQRAFYREFGCNPREYASRPVPLYLFTPYDVKYRHLERSQTHMNQIRTVFLQVMEKPARNVILKRGVTATDYMAYCEEVGCDIWGLLQSIPSPTGEPVCMWLPANLRKPGTSQYVQGVEVDETYDGPIPEGLELIRLPKCEYLMFRGQPFAEEDYCQAIEELQSCIKTYDPTLSGYRWDEANPRIQLEPVGTRGYMELLPIKRAD